ncbi:unannotated protein [freshwater metagenome]|uniref:Unannotated protein n=1 Tax=freshwater metagenome TaxID=449393 RepID=A0A6J7E2I4_9ZZZZ|nr:hypothetical protein [Actinomycetota bacterium]
MTDSEPTATQHAWGLTSSGETRWPAAIAMAGALLLQFRLPEKLTIGPRWALPAVEALVLVTLLIVSPTKFDETSRDVRFVSLGLLALLTGANATTLALLMHNLLKSGSSIPGRSLVYSAVSIWLTGVIAYALWYWEIDRGGPSRRCRSDHAAPDFWFAQMENPGVTRTPWTPHFLDYLYVSVTNSSAFSPTDALPLTLRAKALMSAQSLTSLATIVVVGARAVNILK